MSTNGGIGEALNVGFFALRPHKALFQAAVDFAQLGQHLSTLMHGLRPFGSASSLPSLQVWPRDPRFNGHCTQPRREADFSELTGWANEGWRPSGGYYVGGECGHWAVLENCFLFLLAAFIEDYKNENSC